MISKTLEEPAAVSGCCLSAVVDGVVRQCGIAAHVTWKKLRVVLICTRGKGTTRKAMKQSRMVCMVSVKMVMVVVVVMVGMMVGMGEVVVAGDPTCSQQYVRPELTPKELGTVMGSTWAALDKASSAFRVSQGAPSAAVLTVSWEGQTVHTQFDGVANTSDPTSVPDGNTIFRTGSAGKLFPTILALMAAEDGKLPRGLATTFADLNPKFSMIDPATQEACDGPSVGSTLYQMGGLPREAPFDYPIETPTSDVLERLQDEWLLAPEWEIPMYSNLGFALIGHLVSEYAYDGNFSDVFHQSFVAPLQLSRTGLVFTPEVISEMAVGYLAPNDPIPFPLQFGWVAPAGQMYISSNDFSKFANVIARAEMGISTPGFFLTPSAARRMFGVHQTNDPNQTGFGSPWEEQYIAEMWVKCKGGNAEVYSALVCFVPEYDLSLTLLWNGAVDELAFAVTAWELILPAFRDVLAKYRPVFTPPAPASVYVGNYTSPSEFGSDFAIVELPNTELAFRLGGVDVPLQWHAKNRAQIRQPVPMIGACFNWELTGVWNAYLVFRFDADGSAVSAVTTDMFATEYMRS